MNMFKFIDGVSACVQLLNSLLCAGLLFNFFFTDCYNVNNLLLLLIVFLVNMVVSFISRYLVALFNNECCFQDRASVHNYFVFNNLKIFR